ncbi:Thioesterase/thiol ester dehydrase-isomerase, partial [Rozella allomycis CSF55]
NPIIVGGASNLAARKMSDSYFEINETLREEYVNVYGGLRFGRIMEDLDAVAGSIAYLHCDSFHHQQLVIVTASVDRIDLISFLRKDQDVYLRGNVTYVGSSSMEVTIKVETKKEIDSEIKWNSVAIAKFTMVARDPKANKAVMVNPLKLETEEELLNFQLADGMDRKQLEAQLSLDRQPPTSMESVIIHNLFLEKNKIEKHNNFMYMEDTILKNIHNFIFGGFLMREAFELAFANASLFIKSKAYFVALDELSFKKPVPIGSILTFTAQVVYSEGAPHHSFQVIADVTDVKTGQSDTTNTFYFTFRSKEDNVPKIMPRTYEEAMIYLEGKRRKERGIALTKKSMHQIDAEIYHG